MPITGGASNLSAQLLALVGRAQLEFADVSDYIWKSPRLIEHETELEISKLDAYFPNRTDLRDIRRLRWESESHKLKHTFPYLIAAGNLFSVLSLFETYLLFLATDLEAHSEISVRSAKGQGVAKLFNAMKSMGIAFEDVPLYQQIQAAIRIRNCMVHASGMLSWSRESHELRRIQSSGIYLSREHRQIRIENGRGFDEVMIFSSELGDRLHVSNIYCHVLCSYLTSYFVNLCQAAIDAMCCKPNA